MRLESELEMLIKEREFIKSVLNNTIKLNTFERLEDQYNQSDLDSIREEILNLQKQIGR